MDIPQPAVLREYALLADGHRGLLVGPHGDVGWGCFPRWDSPAVFSSLLGGDGWWTVRPKGRFVWGGYYEDGSLIWRNRWATHDAIVECREALAYPGRPDRAVVVRRLHVEFGEADMVVQLQLRTDFGSVRPRDVQRHDDGSYTARLGQSYVRWRLPPGRYDGRTATMSANCHLTPGRHVDLVLELSTQPLAEPPDTDLIWEATLRGWEDACPEVPAAVAGRDARHAAAVLRGLTSPAGATVAAATTSLPERTGGNRNYDYRYAWIRDQCFVGQAAAAAGLDDLLDSSLAFVSERLLADGPDLRPAYCVDGARVPAEADIDLPGYPGSPELRVGNRAGAQFQLDVFGEALMLAAAAASRDRLDSRGWEAVDAAAAAIEKRWDEPDGGVWETEPRWFAHSRLACAAGLRAVAAISPAGPQTNAWSALADHLLATTAAHSLHPSGRWQRAPDDDRCDSALLVPQVRGLLPPDDPRSVATRQAVTDELMRDQYVFRYPVNREPIGIGEGAFLLCGYWLTQAQEQAGEHVLARALFERHRAACGPAGLYTEEYDVGERQLRGNLPQAFVHAAFLETAVRLGG